MHILGVLMVFRLREGFGEIRVGHASSFGLENLMSQIGSLTFRTFRPELREDCLNERPPSAFIKSDLGAWRQGLDGMP
ncbi:hypothetical protein SAMN02787142_7169 [Burkholderia sp. WP9]|jgi:hypothetical protein|nr:hypothetical protein SAMN02787142_7169 [Burkholderia sp. WP9]